MPLKLTTMQEDITDVCQRCGIITEHDVKSVEDTISGQKFQAILCGYCGKSIRER